MEPIQDIQEYTQLPNEIEQYLYTVTSLRYCFFRFILCNALLMKLVSLKFCFSYSHLKEFATFKKKTAPSKLDKFVALSEKAVYCLLC